MISIVIIEDNEIYRVWLASMMRNNKLFQVLEVYASGEEALLELPEKSPDIVIVDIQLGEAMTGVDLITSVKPLLPDTQFLMLTSYKNDEHVLNALKAGASGYVVKDASIGEIENAVIELYNGGSPMSTYVARKVINLLRGGNEQNFYGLSDRELEVVTLLSKGLIYKEISDRLAISANTVKNHLKKIYKKLHVQNKVEAVNKYRSKIGR